MVVSNPHEENDMTGSTRTDRCEDCRSHVPDFDIIHLTLSDREQRRVCTRCCNTRIAARIGVAFDHPEFESMMLTDIAGTSHQFHFRTRLRGGHVAIEAFEIQNGSPGGYQFQVLGEPEEDLLLIFQRLFERMRRALARCHIEQTELGPGIAKSGEEWVVRGRIEWDPEEDGRVPRLVVDGTSYPWDEVGRMLMTFEGFQVKLEVYDRSEER